MTAEAKARTPEERAAECLKNFHIEWHPNYCAEATKYPEDAEGDLYRLIAKALTAERDSMLERIITIVESHIALYKEQRSTTDAMALVPVLRELKGMR